MLLSFNPILLLYLCLFLPTQQYIYTNTHRGACLRIQCQASNKHEAIAQGTAYVLPAVIKPTPINVFLTYLHTTYVFYTISDDLRHLHAHQSRVPAVHHRHLLLAKNRHAVRENRRFRLDPLARRAYGEQTQPSRARAGPPYPLYGTQLRREDRRDGPCPQGMYVCVYVLCVCMRVCIMCVYACGVYVLPAVIKPSSITMLLSF
jgi:hypothetical protein